MPKVLIGDKLSPAAVEIFHARGIETVTKTGLNTEELIAEIPEYDGLVVRSAFVKARFADFVARERPLLQRRPSRATASVSPRRTALPCRRTRWTAASKGKDYA